MADPPKPIVVSGAPPTGTFVGNNPPKPKPSSSDASKAAAAGTVAAKPVPIIPKRSTDPFQACAIVFLTGPYAGQTLDLGQTIVDSSHSQTVQWEEQKGRSIRQGLTFSHVSPRSIVLDCQFYSLNEDVSPLAENLMTLGEIDDKTGIPGTLLYIEGSIKIQPLVCDGQISIKKSEPIAGQKGYRLADVSIPLKLGGGKTSEHRLAEPLVDTELTRWKKAKTDAEKAREGKQTAALLTLAECLSKEENEQLSKLISENKLSDPNAVRSLSKNSLAHAAVGGLIPASVLKAEKQKLTESIASQIAKSTNGVGNNAGQLEAAILGKPHTLPPDIESQVPLLKSQHGAIVEATLNQQLTPSSPIFNDSETAATLTRSIKCGQRLLSQGPPPKNADQESQAKESAFYQKELKEKAGDIIAQEKLFTDRLNKKLSDKKTPEAKIQKEFGLTSTEQVKALRNAVPFKSKQDFTDRLSKQSIVGLKSWETFKESVINAGA